MLKIKLSVAEKICGLVKLLNEDADLKPADVAQMLEYPPDTSMGDLAFPCFKLSKTLRRSPALIAGSLAEKLSGGCIEKAEAVNGYLNIKISDGYLCDNVLPQILDRKENYGAPT